MSRKCILILCAGLPYPPSDGVRTRVYNITRQLLAEFDVIIVSIIKNPAELDSLPEAQQSLGNSIIPVVVPRAIPWKLISLLSAIFGGRPIEYCLYYFDNVADRIRELLRNNTIDYVQFERSFLCFYADLVPEGIPRIINLYDLESLRHGRLARLVPPWKKMFIAWNQRKIEKFERREFARASKVFAISGAERDAVIAGFKVPESKVGVLTGGIATESYPYIESLPRERAILFVGSGMNFNYDAIRYFYDDIFPLVKNKVPDVIWRIVGKLDKRRLSYLLEDPTVEFSANVPSVIPYYERSRALVVPLRAGSGTRLKIFEAMALGRAIVSTSVGCEGIEVTHGRDIMVADIAEIFAASVSRLLLDDDANNVMRMNAYNFVKRNYDWREACVPLIQYYKGSAA